MENYEPPPPPHSTPSQASQEPVCLCSRGENSSNGDVEGYVHLHNPHLAKLGSDHLYHLALSTTTHSLVDMFGDVKHGMGAPSMSILLHEVFKLLHYARCRDVLMFRIGTSGGVGVPPGSVVVSTGVVNGLLREEVDMHVLGKLVSRPTKLDVKLAEEIAAEARRSLSGINVVLGKTMSTDDFYESQGRMNGAFCDYTDQEELQFLEKLRSVGVVNIEMEAALFAAFCHRAGIKGAVVCGIFQDRLKTERATEPQSVITEWQLRSQHVVLCFIQHRLATAGSSS
ncbi:hypothetical protein HPB51_006129 [Rhipicephalus microplus]|uniref:Nucleoside phosphorylase domain-containing protein n=1 Tax=Rhipicephalus microplus TaxID=6941 RepID=A0A9J6ERR5_RHIMP|nr:uridine phosphorylase 1-like [Rhipicephalus microplus]KAH8036860.1 hypothetical protein HPB51_006129 [Rhipicephalus microplus]